MKITFRDPVSGSFHVVSYDANSGSADIVIGAPGERITVTGDSHTFPATVVGGVYASYDREGYAPFVEVTVHFACESVAQAHDIKGLIANVSRSCAVLSVVLPKLAAPIKTK